jgi:hypothetical protein
MVKNAFSSGDLACEGARGKRTHAHSQAVRGAKLIQKESLLPMLMRGASRDIPGGVEAG